MNWSGVRQLSIARVRIVSDLSSSSTQYTGPSCDGFTLNAGGGDCYLKSAFGPPRANAGAVSGVVRREPTPTVTAPAGKPALTRQTASQNVERMASTSM